MGLTAMVVGSVSGFGMQMMNNALQKVPLSRSESSCFITFFNFNVVGVRTTLHIHNCRLQRMRAIFLSVYAEMVSDILITMAAGAGCGLYALLFFT